jgi:hypothetical protein
MHDEGTAPERQADDERVGEMARLDGNAAAGMLSEVFIPDLTTASTTCATCGSIRMLGRLLVYVHGMGMVMRCPSCDGVVLRIARTRRQLWLDPTGAKLIVMEDPTAPSLT